MKIVLRQNLGGDGTGQTRKVNYLLAHTEKKKTKCQRQPTEWTHGPTRKKKRLKATYLMAPDARKDVVELDVDGAATCEPQSVSRSLSVQK